MKAASVVGVSRTDRLFFFPSRRRHTIFDCDWSSDVCSSDLLGLHAKAHPVEDTQQSDRNDGWPAGRAGDEAQFAVAQEHCGCHGTERAVAGSNGIGVGLHQFIERVGRSEEHTSELQSQSNLVCRLLLEKKKNNPTSFAISTRTTKSTLPTFISGSILLHRLASASA